MCPSLGLDDSSPNKNPTATKMQTRTSRKPLSSVKINLSKPVKKTIFGNKSSSKAALNAAAIKPPSKSLLKKKTVVVQKAASPAPLEPAMADSVIFPHEDDLKSFRYSLGVFKEELMRDNENHEFEEAEEELSNQLQLAAGNSALLFDSLPISPIQKESFQDFTFLHDESQNDEEQTHSELHEIHPESLSDHPAPVKEANISYDDPFGLISTYKLAKPTTIPSASFPTIKPSVSSPLYSSSNLKKPVSYEKSDDEESEKDAVQIDVGCETDSLGDGGSSLDSFDFLLAPGQVAEQSPKPVKATKLVLIKRKARGRAKATKKK